MQRLQILQNDSQKKTHVVIGETKSKSSDRYIPLTDYTLEVCRKLQTSDPQAFLLTGVADKYMEPRTLQYRLSKILKECDLKGIHFHTLRHTFATRCIEVGFEIKSLSEILGHSNTKVTLDRYIHSSMELKRLNMIKLTSPEQCRQLFLTENAGRN
jgi:integrase